LAEKIFIDFPLVEECSASLKKSGDKALDIEAVLRQVSLDMHSAWEDIAQVKFEKSYDEMKYELIKISDCFNAMSSLLDLVSETYRNTDSSIRNLF